ncbi:MAG TPA: hypothetical protein VJN44_05130 [Roseateles sp.]|nr:hypothetical protein [Roseateles sp.]
MWISTFWYEKLPALYAGAGLLSLALLGRPAAFSATLLLGAAGLVTWWRRDHRRPD